jgi:hypothetical protein
VPLLLLRFQPWPAIQPFSTRSLKPTRRARSPRRLLDPTEEGKGEGVHFNERKGQTAMKAGNTQWIMWEMDRVRYSRIKVDVGRSSVIT